ncbi:MAG: Gfo/Idh/MocA family oxidoreductase, partial [Telluria sp.]|nr:Gfo/Idh/MocA family oxidoreductase [Telluria sp.]
YADALADPDIDGIVLTTPDRLHPEHVIQAVRAGKPVLVEKPFALERAAAQAAADAARDAGVVLAFAHNRRFLPAVREIERLLASGALGRVLHVEGNFSSSYGLRIKPGMWRADAGQTVAGGMTGMGIHQIDLMIHLAGSITGVQSKARRQVVEVDIEDNHTMLLDFASGATGSFTTLMTTSPMWRFRILGSKGWAEMIGETRLLVCEGSNPVHEIHFAPVSTERLELEAFAEAIGGGAAYPVSADEALNGVSVLEAVVESARHDGRIQSVG